MTKEEKQLLLITLCGMLPYGVKALTPWEKDGPGLVTLIDITSSRQVRVFEDWYKIEEVKPYLRPMSSMTEEEKDELLNLRKEMNMHMHPWIDRILDFYLSHHLDWRGLILLGLALEAPEDMYKTE